MNIEQNKITKKSLQTKKSSKKGLFVLIIIIVIAMLTFVASLLFTKNTDSGFTSPWKRITTNDYIAILRIEGTIASKSDYYDQEWLLNTIDDLKTDTSNKGIILDINSPGGTVYEADQTYLALLDYKDETGRPIIAYFEQLAASGGYYIGCAADKIWANRNTLTGSIGVIAGESYDLSKLFEKYGITYNVFTAGKNKSMLGISTPVTDEQRDIMESIADECYSQFCAIVSNSRNLSLNEVQLLADGRIYTALQAKNNGLIDYIGSLDDMDIWIQDRFNDQIQNAKYIWYKPDTKTNFLKSLLTTMTSISTIRASQEQIGSEIQNVISTLKTTANLPENLSYPAYYWNH